MSIASVSFVVFLSLAIFNVTYAACPKGWVLFGDHCYLFNSAMWPFDKARDLCRSREADLASISTDDEHEFVGQVVMENRENYWIGLKRESGNDFKWLDESTPGVSPGDNKYWDNSCPSSCNGDCVSVAYARGLWANSGCNINRRFVCKRRENVLDVCDIDSGWLAFGDMCYKYSEEKRTWQDAHLQCAALTSNARLAVLSRPEQFEALDQVVNCKDYNSAVWIGLSDMDDKTNFKWVDGSQLSNTNWASNQPSKPNEGGSNCVNAAPMFDYKWIVGGCDDMNEYVCQRPQGACAPGWESFDSGHCYLVVGSAANQLTWSDAELFCQRYGPASHLIKISSAQDQQTLMKVAQSLRSAGISQFYIGVSEGWLCPDGTETDQQTGRCYSFSQDYVTFDVALQKCSSMGMKLLTLNSTEDQSFVSYRVADMAWIGLEFKGNGIYQWYDGLPLRFENWVENGHDGDVNNKACVVMQRTGLRGAWKAEDCQSEHGYICFQQATHVTQGTPSGPTPAWNAECGADWKYNPLDEACYKLNHEEVTFGNAEQLCIAQGGHLASIHSPNEQNFIAGMVMNYVGSLNYWIGANDRDRSSGWQWTDGTPFYYWNWNIGEPNNKGGEEFCVELSAEIMSVRWNDIECSRTFGYICKKPATTATAHPSAEPTKAPVTCDRPQPVVSGVHYVRDNAIYASTTSGDRWPKFARINNVAGGGNPGSWTGLPDDPDPWLTVVFTHYMMIEGIQTRGAGDRDEWVKEYTIAYRLQYATFFEPLRNASYQTMVFTGNSDRDTIQEHSFRKLILVHAIRIRIRTFQTAPSMRIEFVGCRYETCDFQPLVSGESMVPDVRLTASGSWDQFHTPDRARINTVVDGSYGSGWIPNAPWNTDQWIQAELDSPMAIYAVQTKGLDDKAQWCTQYKLRFTENLDSPWETYQEPYGTEKVFTGNSDQNTLVTNYLAANIYGVRYVRIVPQAWASGGMGLRFEILGCNSHYEGCSDIPLLTGSGSYVPNSRLSASSELSSSTGPARSRLNQQAYGTLAGAWVPAVNDDQQWIQADLGKKNLILAIATQGRSEVTMYVTAYKLSYSDNGVTFNPYPNGTVKIFEGNWDSNRVHKYYLTPTFEARYVRLHPVQWNVSIALRWEIYACAGWATYEIIGCFADDNDDRDLDGPTGWYPPDGMTLNKCASYCRSLGYLYAGAQFSYECFCGNRYGRHGPSDNCVYQCSGNPVGSTEICGGPGANTVMHTGIYSPDQVVGCYSDTLDRDLPYEALLAVPGGVTQPFCALHCFNKGYRYAGAQYGEECFCGNTYGRYGPSSRCNMRCGGDQTHMTFCGGDWSNTIISTGIAPDHLGCRTGWKQFGRRCYFFEGTRTTWVDARVKCNEMGAVLATVNYQAINDFLIAEIATLRLNSLWIGLHCRRTNNYFEWLSEDPVLYTNWDRREPNAYSPDENCVEVYTDGKWNDDPCNEPGVTMNGYVCQADLEERQDDVTPTPDPSCPPYAQAFRWKCYTLIRQAWSWQNAQQQCEGLEPGSSLVRITDDYEQAFLSSTYIRDAGVYWTDLREIKSEFVYSNGDHPLYTNWAVNQPGFSVGSSCVMMNMSDHGKWEITGCAFTAFSICQIPRQGWTIPPPTPTVPVNAPCAAGWSSLGSTSQYCFALFTPTPNLRRDWYGARAACEAMGANLVSIHRRDENNEIQIQTMSKLGDFWIGLADMNDNAGYKWSDGSPVDFENWSGPGRSGQQLAEDTDELQAADARCVAMYQATGAWQNIDCGSLRNWICKLPKGAQAVTTTTQAPPDAGPPGSCAPDNDEWKSYNGKCYRLSSQNAEVTDWWSAEDKCRQAGGHLASIHNADEQRFIEGRILADLEVYGVWIGLNDINAGGRWTWSDDSPTDFVHWGVSAPTGEKSLCVAMDGRAGGFGRWIDLHCQTSYPYVCSKYRGGATITTTPSVPLPGNCPDGYVTYFNKCFRFVEEQATWADAHTRCQQMGARPYGLASIADKMEQGFLTSFLSSSDRSSSSYWIGLHEFSGITGEYGWIDNTPVTFTNWGEYRPSGQADRGCVSMFAEPFRAGQWTDGVCSSTLPYICMRLKDPNAPPQQVNNGPCPENYLLWQGNCYRGLSGSRSWQESENECAKETDGHLTSVANRYEQGFVASRFRDIGAELWIGLTDKQVPGRYQWSDGASVTYTSWSSGAPSSTNGGCVFMSRTNYNDWVEGPCEASYGAVCKITKVPASSPRPPAGGCPTDIVGNNWMEFDIHCYLFRPQARVIFNNASIECELLGGRLASIHSDEENDFVFQHLAPNTEQMQWIGLMKSPTGEFLWLDGSAQSYYLWNSGEPNGEAEQCVEMYMHNGRWNDIDCNNRNGYVCKRRKVGTDGSTLTTTRPSIPQSSSTTTGTTTTGPPTTPFSVGPILSTTYRMIVPPDGSNSGDGGSGRPITSAGVVGITFGVILLAMLITISGYVYFKRQRNALLANSGFNNPTFAQQRDATA